MQLIVIVTDPESHTVHHEFFWKLENGEQVQYTHSIAIFFKKKFIVAAVSYMRVASSLLKH